ncbi:MAG: cytochrome c3 family protein [Nitrospirota bacterium]
MLCRYVLGILLVLAVFPSNGFSAESSVSAADQTCMMCHSQEQDLTFDAGEKVSLKVNTEELGRSVHRIISCSDCHGFTADQHPKRTFKNHRQYTAFSAKVCTQCHVSHKTKIHAKLLSQAPTGTVCTDCHGFHSIRRARELPKGNHYCLNCHQRELSITFKTGEKQSIHINEEILNISVHKNLSCTDCHFGFSSEEHPLRIFKSKRDYSIAMSESCRRCHFDKYSRTLEGIHYNLLTHGNLNAPVCTDCHGAHSVYSGRKEKLANAKKCERCHPEVYKVYTQSVHGGALILEHNEDVPICSDCHKAHDMTDPRTTDFRNAVPQMCGNCHADKDLMKKYGLSTAVVDTYLQDFHGVTLKFYKQQGKSVKPIAVCIDCHGIHDITKVNAPNAPMIKANLVKRCQKCHPGATANFPDSWVSHYKPSLKKAPLVYMINFGYKVFIPFMIIGLILQIILHIWRYAVNR